VDPPVDADFVTLRHHAALLIGVQERRHRGNEEGRGDSVLLQKREDAGYAYATPILSPGQLADGHTAVPQFVGLVVGGEGEGDRPPGSVFPCGGSEGAPGAHVVHHGPPAFLWPLPGFEVV